MIALFLKIDLLQMKSNKRKIARTYVIVKLGKKLKHLSHFQSSSLSLLFSSRSALSNLIESRSLSRVLFAMISRSYNRLKLELELISIITMRTKISCLFFKSIVVQNWLYVIVSSSLKHIRIISIVLVSGLGKSVI